MRILVLIAIGLLLYIILSKFIRQARIGKGSPIIDSENMVQCHYCQLHILEQEAIAKGDYYYCSKEHLDEDK